MIKYYKAPLDEDQRRKINIAVKKLDSLADITRTETIYRVIIYLLEDKPLLEQYLTKMAELITKQRTQISTAALIKKIFHTTGERKLSGYNEDFVAILTGVINREREIQKHIFIAENHLQVDINNDLWKIYERNGDALRLITLNFLLINCPPLRYELKDYLRYIFKFRGKLHRTIFDPYILALNALTDVNPKIRYFTDVTEADVKAMILFLENTYKKENGEPLSQKTIALAVNSAGRVIRYLMSDACDSEIKTPRPHINPFANIIFHNLGGYSAPTSIIPEDIIEQINKYSDELPPLYKLLYDIFTNTGMRVKEVFFLEADCVEESHYAGICQLKFKPYKVLAARRRHGAGDYHRVMITQSLADRISFHINDTEPLRRANGLPYIFLSQKPGYTNAVMMTKTFINKVRSIIKNHAICDENGDLWHLTTKQFRKTIAVTLIENGATTEELAYWLGHMSSATATKYYAEVRKMKLAQLNTKFFKEKFDLILSGEQLEKYTEEERKLLYIDFRLDQRRVEFGYCLIKAADGRCPNRNSLYNCVNCKNLCTGVKYLSYWNELLIQQEDIVERLIHTYHANNVEGYADFTKYKQEFRLLEGYRNIVIAIKEVDVSND
ncbi:MAG: site-specific integrase [Clostridiales bacterium]|jgi:integrase|nr:site-specific integrase [Clostridiales bacterium]